MVLDFIGHYVAEVWGACQEMGDSPKPTSAHLYITLPKFNMEPKNDGFSKRKTPIPEWNFQVSC